MKIHGEECVLTDAEGKVVATSPEFSFILFEWGKEIAPGDVLAMDAQVTIGEQTFNGPDHPKHAEG